MSDRTWCLIVASGIMLLVLAGFSFQWYRASLQSAVYAREGIEVTTWEVFMGARPAERTINWK